jgi:hypothetical protein
MNQSHFPRWLAILLFLLVAGTLFIGISQTFTRARAAFVSSDNAQEANLSFRDPLPAGPSPTFTGEATGSTTPQATFTPTATPIPNPGYADTTGIIALGLLMVVVMLVGMLWAWRTSQKKKPGKPS